jgi:3-hydroxy-3-methylglutaryl CoA synthase
VPHQANQRIIEAAARGLDLPMERCQVNLERYGNTSTASIPIAACEAAKEGRLKRGDKVVFVGFGAGLTWGALAMEWSGPIIERRKLSPTRFAWWARLRSAIRRLVRHIEGWIWGRE